MAREAALHHVLSSLDGYARFIVGRPLRPYQHAPAALAVEAATHATPRTATGRLARRDP